MSLLELPAPTRVGLFGGSFDPIHRGHIDPVVHAREALRLDRIYYLPTAQPPHKDGRRFAPALRRFCMVELALLEHPRLVASGFELTEGRSAYTIDTVRRFASSHPAASLHLIIGADSYLELHQWRSWRQLVRLVTLVVLARPGFDISRGVAPALRRELDETRVVLLEHELVDLSSTELRGRLRAGGDVSDSELPRPVLEYCRKYSLYR